MTGGDAWRKLARAAQSDRRAAQRRGSGHGRAQADRPGMVRVVTTTPTLNRQPTKLAPIQPKETTVSDSHDDHQDHEDDQLLAEQAARHRQIDALIADAKAEAEQAVRDLPISPFEWAARHFEQQAAEPDPSDCPADADPSDRP